MVSPGLKLSIEQLPIELEREQTLNLMSESLHSTSTVAYHLSIALLTVSHHKMG
jgi:DNA-binding CsgD family transcriptional regulator